VVNYSALLFVNYPLPKGSGFYAPIYKLKISLLQSKCFSFTLETMLIFRTSFLLKGRLL
jgi:hypothetical protein